MNQASLPPQCIAGHAIPKGTLIYTVLTDDLRVVTVCANHVHPG